ncbi:MAG: phosphoenolpyruvate--protein phosphotransferase [Spirochaeta sp. LUC14_002_19_P3]|nr:MAG: phosphoenolpyruvate--protein phosphotransferase [Spirochaeta sp. LUC14_002_19_P3]
MKKKEKKNPGADMICSVSELVNLVKQGQDILGVLSTMVSIVCRHTEADACSIYLYNEKKKKLVLQASAGLNPELTGNFSMSLDEGLIGLTLKELRPVCESKGQDNPAFKPIPNSGEEQYTSFLAIPIVRGSHRVGVLALQDREPAQFTESDIQQLQAIASQLSPILESAQLLIEIPEKYQQPRKELKPVSLIRGTPVVEGVAIGEAYYIEGPEADSSFITAYDTGYSETIEGFHSAIARTEEQLETLQAQLEEELTDVASLIFSSHMLMLRDAGFSGAMEKLIKEGTAPSEAVIKVANDYISIFSASSNPRMREKMQDTKDLGHRILKNLIQNRADTGNYSGHIVLTNELLPSELLKLAAQKVEGIVLFGGGTTAHINVLASSLHVPLIFTEDENLFNIPSAANLALDALEGVLFVQPDQAVLKRLKQLKAGAERLEHQENEIQEKTFTADGERIYLRAAVNLISDLQLAQRFKAEGIGLYRSEFPFLIRSDVPTEEEQYRIYRIVIRALGHPLATLRTLDVGGDKTLSYIPDTEEANPFLGLRGIRFLLKNRLILAAQLRAMIRAGGTRKPLRILFPLISSLDDFRDAKNVVEYSLKKLEKEGHGRFPFPKLGAMIELPSAVEMAQELAQEADFLSLGTNDLIQYMLGIDRTNEKVASLYDTCHPSVLRAVVRVAEAAREARCPLSVCGTMGSDPCSIYFMMGLGIKEFTMPPSRIPAIQTQVVKMKYKQAQKDAKHIASLGTLTEVRKFLTESAIT